MKLQIRVDKDTDKISEVKFKTFGCGSAIASSSYLTELVRGMTLEEAGRIRNTEIAKELCLPPVKCMFSVFLILVTRWIGLVGAHADLDSALLYARGGCDQVRYLELLYQEPQGQDD